MKTRALSTALLLFLSFSLVAQNYQLIPYRKADKWGYADSSGKIIIKPKYQDAIPFLNNHAAIKEKGKWGIMNLQEEVLVGPKFDSVSGSFYQGYFSDKTSLSVYYEGKWRDCDTNGNIISGMEMEMEMMEVEEGDYWDSEPQIFMKDGKYGIKTRGGTITHEAKYQKLYRPSDGVTLFYFQFNDKWGIINWKSEIVASNIYDSIKLGLSAYTIVSLNWKMGLLDYKGSPVLALEYDEIKADNYKGYFLKEASGLMAYADRKGKLIIKPKYLAIQKHYADSAYSYFEDGKWGYSDTKHGISIQAKYLKIDEFQNGYAEVLTLAGKKGYINRQGKEFFID